MVSSVAEEIDEASYLADFLACWLGSRVFASASTSVHPLNHINGREDG